jgi:hypothetical protein
LGLSHISSIGQQKQVSLCLFVAVYFFLRRKFYPSSEVDADIVAKALFALLKKLFKTSISLFRLIIFQALKIKGEICMFNV